MRRKKEKGKAGEGSREKGRTGGFFGIALLSALLFFPVLTGKAADGEDELQREYRMYQERFASIERMEDLEENGYEVMEEQIFPVTL